MGAAFDNPMADAGVSLIRVATLRHTEVALPHRCSDGPRFSTGLTESISAPRRVLNLFGTVQQLPSSHRPRIMFIKTYRGNDHTWKPSAIRWLICAMPNSFKYNPSAPRRSACQAAARVSVLRPMGLTSGRLKLDVKA